MFSFVNIKHCKKYVQMLYFYQQKKARLLLQLLKILPHLEPFVKSISCKKSKIFLNKKTNNRISKVNIEKTTIFS